jgi:PAS domain S-box-containing protein
MPTRPDLPVAWLALTAGLVVAGVVGVIQWRDAALLAATEREFHAEQRAEAVQIGVERSLHMLDVVAAFIAATPPDEDAFTRFAEPLVRRDPALVAVGHNVLVTGAARARYEAERAARHPGFRLTERRAGELVPAAERAEYVVVQFIAPIAENRKALGFDIASEPVRAAAISATRSSGVRTASAPIHLVQDDVDQHGFLAIEPVGDDAFAVGVFRVPDILRASLQSLEPVDVDVWVTDVTAEPHTLYRWSGAERRLHPAAGSPPAGAGHRDVQVAGRTWRLAFTSSSAATLPPVGVPLFIVAASAFLFVLLRGRERERRLAAESADRLELALEAVTSGSWDWSLSRQQVVLSRSWLSGLGYSISTETHGEGFWRDTLHPDDRGAWQAALDTHLDGSESVFVARGRRRASDGSWRWYQDRGRVVERDARGVAVRIVGAGTDIGADVEREERDRAREQSHRRAQRMESLGLLAGGVAHDFNNLLVPILGSVDEVDLALPGDSPALRAVASIRTAAQHAADLTRQMLDYVGRSSSELRPVDAGDVLRELAALLRASVPRRLDVGVDVEDGLPQVVADLGQLKQVVLNLAMNAADSQPGSGEVRVRVFAGAPEGTAVVGRLPSPRGVCLEVRDAGPGLPDDLDTLFDPFFTTRDGGRGLGLAVVQGVVQAHDGGIAVVSTPQGSTFQVWLPLAPAPTPSAPPVVADGADAGPRRVLIVDDDEEVRWVLRRALAAAGHVVAEAEDGMVALDAADRDPFDVVVLDLEMPRMGGLEALPGLLERLPHARIILCSGYSSERVGPDVRSHPRVSWLDKPFRMQRLVELIAPGRS